MKRRTANGDASAEAAATDAKFNGWDAVPPGKRNIFQKIAAWTHGVVTPANTLTVTANAVAMTGIVQAASGNVGVGAALFAAGRVGDYLDGKLARSTGTQSYIGEALDVAGDKLQTIGGLGILAVWGDYPPEASIPTLATQLVIVGASALATRRGADLHPAMPGKIGLGATGASMAGFEAAKALSADHAGLAEMSSVASYVLMGVSVVAGLKAAWDYRRQGQAAAAVAHEAPLPVAGPQLHMPTELA